VQWSVYRPPTVQGESCCETGQLNTEDDNWELGQVDWFVGRQVGDCWGWEVDPAWPLLATLLHHGSNAGRIVQLELTIQFG